MLLKAGNGGVIWKDTKIFSWRSAAEKFGTKQSHPLVGTHNQTQYEYQHEPLGVVPTYPSHPLGGNLPRNKHI